MIYARVFLVWSSPASTTNQQDPVTSDWDGAHRRDAPQHPAAAPSLGPPPDDAPVVAPVESLPGAADAPALSATAAEPNSEAAIHDAEQSAGPEAAATATRYCENCGAERRPEGRFCTSCGQA